MFYECFQKARVFVPGKPFQPSAMFVGKVRSQPWSGALMRGISLTLSPALPLNIRLEWKGLQVTNTLTNCGHL